MDFGDKYLKGLPISRTFNTVPYPPSTAAIPWTIPTGGGPTTPPATAPPTTPATATPTTPPVTTTPSTVPEPCGAAYRTVNSWQGGFQGEATVRAGSDAINSWSVRWTTAPSITPVWGGTLSGGTVRNASWNGSLAPNASTTFGFIVTGSPTTPTLTCTSP
jgi:hypothetical protein